ncbi:MAG: 3'-5' exonuclease [Alistipes sp.]|nr:3'-5' exonuclease [Candidatus Alistipes equi]
MQLNLRKPLIFFDLETTGVSIAKDRIVEISMIKLMPNGERIVKTRRINPQMHIPEQATAVHHITDEDVAHEPTFRQIANSLKAFMQGCDFAGFNSNRFDMPLLVEEFMRAGVDVDFKSSHFVDVQTIFHKKEQRTLSAAYLFYCGKELGDAAHGAQADTSATIEVLESQLDKYPDLRNDIGFLEEFSTTVKIADYAGLIGINEQQKEIFNFGKHKDKPIEDVFRAEPSYYNWCMKADFPEYSKKIMTQIYLRCKSNL